MKSFRCLVAIVICVVLSHLGFQLRAADNPFLGQWSLHLPGGGAGWLGVSGAGDQIKAEMLWGGGSIFPLNSAVLESDKLIVTRLHETDRKDAAGKPIPVTETLTATLEGDNNKFVTVTPKDGGGENRAEFSGHRQPPLPSAPDLSALKFGPAVQLFNGVSLDGWRLVESGAASGWRATNGILVNDISEVPGHPHRRFGNLRTEAAFEDFALHAETRVAKEGNSGIYLRGIYEVQVFDSFGKPTDSHNMGAIYSRIKPLMSAEKPAGEWQTLDIVLAQRHVTVTLNGKLIIDNQPILGPTGGALWPEVDRPGPIYLQGDHTGIEYRNLMLRPILKN